MSVRLPALPNVHTVLSPHTHTARRARTLLWVALFYFHAFAHSFYLFHFFHAFTRFAFSGSPWLDSSPPPPPAAVKWKDDPQYALYFKKLRIGRPLIAVKKEVTAAGLDPEILDKDPESLSPLASPPPSTAVGVKLKDDPQYAEFFKKRRIGISAMAVKDLMKKAGLDPEILDKDPESLSPLASPPPSTAPVKLNDVPSTSESSASEKKRVFAEELAQEAVEHAARVKKNTTRITLKPRAMKRPDLMPNASNANASDCATKCNFKNDEECVTKCESEVAGRPSSSGVGVAEDDPLWHNVQTRGEGEKPAVISLKQAMLTNYLKWLMHKSEKLNKDLGRSNEMNVKSEQSVMSVEQNMAYFMDWMTRAVGEEVISAAASAQSTDSLFRRVVEQLSKDPDEKRLNELVDYMMKSSRAYTRYVNTCTLRCEYLRTFEYRKYEVGRGINRGPLLPFDADITVPEEEQYV